MSDVLGVSIVIVNYNNERFLAAAIDSALNQNHPLCEVIVVDDCSTDNSRAAIARYGDRIKSVLRETNGHHIAALNSGWPLACHPILFFLDSDDLLLPHAATTVASVWKASTVKAQFLLASIDKEGQPLGRVAPQYPPNLDTATIRTELLRTGQCPSTPSSGNAYARSLLERMSSDGGFELEYLRNRRDLWMDAVLECSAPFYGEIVTIYEPLACFRIHDANDSLQNSISYARFAQGVRYLEVKLEYLSRRCGTWGIPFDSRAALHRSLWAYECRLCAIKTASAGSHPRESAFGLLGRGVRACMVTPTPISRRLVRAGWFVAVVLAPRFLARQLIALRFMPASRPVWLNRSLHLLRWPDPKKTDVRKTEFCAIRESVERNET
jgi:glycosyltransferase involved in cell wall biosynthesis